MTELKNCPFCSGKPEVKRTPGACFKIICSQCKMQTHAKCSVDVAAEIWNRRVHERNMMEEFPYAGWSKNDR